MRRFIVISPESPEHDAETWLGRPLTDDESAIGQIAEWGPAEVSQLQSSSWDPCSLRMRARGIGSLPEVAAPRCVSLVLPPLGYALSPALDARSWVPTEFQSGRVPTVTLCVLDEGIDPAGVCFGTDDSERVLVEESNVEGHRLVLVASSGDGFTADEMIAEWHGAAFTSAWKTSVGWTSPLMPVAEAAVSHSVTSLEN